jgi:hypothetical protein
VSTSVQGSSIRINTILPVTKILTDLNFGLINGNSSNIIEFHNNILNIDFGTVSNPSSLNFNFGEI